MPLRIQRKDNGASALKKQIDEMVRAGTQALPLQGRTLEEIAIVEGKK
jgi:hypothetical protein